MEVAPPTPASPPAEGTRRILGWAALGLGAATGIAAGTFIGLRQGALNDLDTRCASHTHCDPIVEPIVARGSLDATMVNVFSTLTLVCAAGGAALLLSAPASAQPAPQVTLVPTLGPRGAGLSLGGRF
ncbi:MAG: hypothetical protein ABI193_07160 [Minicystis sp.]